MLEETAKNNPLIYKKILEKEATSLEFKIFFNILLDSLKKSNDSEKIVHFFNKIIKHRRGKVNYEPLLR
jgi:hypothetical protein